MSVWRQVLSDSSLNVYSICAEGWMCFVFDEQQRKGVREGSHKNWSRRRITDKLNSFENMSAKQRGRQLMMDGLYPIIHLAVY